MDLPASCWMVLLVIRDIFHSLDVLSKRKEISTWQEVAKAFCTYFPPLKLCDLFGALYPAVILYNKISDRMSKACKNIFNINVSESNIRRFDIVGCHCQVKCLALVLAYKYVYNYVDKVTSS